MPFYIRCQFMWQSQTLMLNLIRSTFNCQLRLSLSRRANKRIPYKDSLVWLGF